MKFCLPVTVALDIFIKEKNNTFIFLGFLLCHFSMQKVSTRSKQAESYPINHFPTPPPPGYYKPSAYYILHKFPTPLLKRNPPFIRDLRVTLNS